MGGGKPAGSTATSYPKWAEPYYKEMAQESRQLAYDTPQELYGYERIADFTPSERAAQEGTQNMFLGGDQYTPQAMAGLGQSRSTLGGMEDIQSGYQASNFDFGTFGQQQAQDYMSPYMQNVVEAEKRAALEEYERQGMRTSAETVASGARGGYREALEQMMAGTEQGRVVSEIQQRGSQRAFENAQQQYERDRAASIQAAQMGDQSAYRAAEQRMQANMQTQQNLLSQAQQYSDLGMRTSDLGTTAQQNELARLGALTQTGKDERAMEQARYNLGYEDFMRQQSYPQERINWMSGILSGVPQTPGGAYTTTPGPGLVSQLIGGGLGAAGINKLLKG